MMSKATDKSAAFLQALSVSTEEKPAIAAKAEARSDVKRHLMAAVRDTTRRRPAELAQDFQRAQIFNEPVR